MTSAAASVAAAGSSSSSAALAPTSLFSERDMQALNAGIDLRNLVPPPPAPLPSSNRRPLSPDQHHTNAAGDRAPSNAPARTHCPVPGCLLAVASHRGWPNFAGSMQAHIDAHLSGALSGHVPSTFLETHNRTRCRVCGLCAAPSRRVHARCQATARRAEGTRGTRTVLPPGPSASSGVPSFQEVLMARISTLR